MSNENENLQQIWTDVVEGMRADSQLQPRLKGFLGLAAPKAIVEDLVVISVPNDLTRHTFERELRQPLGQAFSEALGRHVSFAFALDSNMNTDPHLQRNLRRPRRRNPRPWHPLNLRWQRLQTFPRWEAQI